MFEENNFFINKIKILKKIDNSNGIFTHLLPCLFDTKERNIIDFLLSNGDLFYVFEGDTPYDEDRKIILTKTGKTTIFCCDNSELIINFCYLLEEFGYNNNLDLIVDFLTTQDLTLEPSEILTIDNFKNFSIIYDRNIYLDNTNNEDNIVKILTLRNKIRNFE